MAEKNNATCAICGKGYHMCVSCKDVVSVNPWKKHTDTSEHYKVYQILHGYSTGVYTKEEAKKKFDAVDMSDLNTFRSGVKKVIREIMSEDTAAVHLDVLGGVESVTPVQPAEATRPKRRRSYERSDDAVE